MRLAKRTGVLALIASCFLSGCGPTGGGQNIVAQALAPPSARAKPSSQPGQRSSEADQPRRPVPAITGPAVVSAVPEDHFVSEEGVLVALDLEHGSGSAMLTLRRTWFGQETLNTHFGSGWSDINWMRLTLLNPDSLLLWRGGVGWRSAHREKDGEDLFVTQGGETIRRTPEGWTMRSSSGETLIFDRPGRLLSEEATPGQIRRYQYDDRDRLVSVGGDPENMLRYWYEGKRVSRVEGPEGLRLAYQYDAQGRLLAVTNARKIRIQYGYNSEGALVAATDSFGSRIALPQARSTARAEAPAEEPAPRETARASLDSLVLLPRPVFKFDSQGRAVEKTVDGWITTYGYDRAGRVESMVTPEGRAAYAYDRFGRLTSVTQPDGHTTRIEYNSLDLPVLVAGSDGTRQTLAYNEHGMLIRSQEAPQQWTEVQYDAAGRVNVLRRSPSAEERYTYDSEGRVAEIAHSPGKKVRNTYDQAGNLVTESWSSGEKHQWTYDAEGRVVAMVDENGLRTTYTYDAQGRLAQSEDSLRGKTIYPDSGQSTQSTVEREGVGRWSYETTSWGRPVAVTEPSGQKTLFQYNPRGKPLEVIPPSGLPWRYEYDHADRLVGIAGPGGLRTALLRDPQGRVAAVLRGDVLWRHYQYDFQGRVQAESSATGLATAYRWGADGRLEAVRFPDGECTYRHEASGTQTLIAGPDFQLHRHFHADGSLARQVYQPAQLDLRLPLDDQGRPAGIELNDLRVSYGYNDRGQLQSFRLPNGTAIEVTRDLGGRPVELSFGSGFGIRIAYDRADRVTAMEAASTAGPEPVFDERYGYDAVGNLIQIGSGSGKTKRLQYDADGRLVQATDGRTAQSFGYDAQGNLWTTGSGNKDSRWVLDRLGRPTAREELTYTWDAAGNLAVTEGPHSAIENTFDAAGRLLRRRLGPLEWRYGYLPDGDRLWQEDGAGRTWYAYLDSGLAGFKNEQGVTWLLVSLPGSDWPLALCGSNGETYFAVADRLHSLRRLVDSRGTVAASAEYGPFGNRESAGGGYRFGLFAGMLRDESGLLYARQRYYDPHLARFISMDPELGALEIPASHNPYGYAANNPYRFRDTSGASTNWAEAMPKIAARKAAFTPPRFPATEVRSGMSIMTHPETEHLLSAASRDKLAQIGRSLERNERILQNPHVSEAARARAQQAVTRLADQTAKIAREFKDANLAQTGRKFDPGWSKRNPTSVNPAASAESSTGQFRRFGPDNNAANLSLEERLKRQAAKEAEEKAAEKAAARGAAEGAGAAGEEVAEGAFRRWGGRILRVGGKLIEIWTIKELIEKHIEEGEALAANNEEIEARRTAKGTIEELKKKLGDLLRKMNEDPNLRGQILFPRDYTGTPDDIDEVIRKIGVNIDNNRKPLDGILLPSGKTLPPEALKGLRAALTAARGFIRQARVLELALRNAERDAAEQNALAKRKLADAVTASQTKGPLLQELTQLPTAVADLRAQTAAVQGALQEWKRASQPIDDAVRQTQDCAGTVCDYARRSASATEDDVKTWKADAKRLMDEAAGGLDAAQKTFDKGAVSLDKLQQSKERLEALETRAEVQGRSLEISDALAAARAATAAAARLRAPVTQHLAEIESLRQKAIDVLQPYTWDDEVPPLVTEASSLAAGLQTPNPLWQPENLLAAGTAVTDAFLAWAINAERIASTVDFKSLFTSADQAINDVKAMAKAEDAYATTRGFQALLEAKACYDLIKVPESPRIAVPPLVGMTEEDAIAAISGAGFKRGPSRVSANMAKDESVAEGKEGTVAQQAPEAGALAAADDAITLYLYPKPEEVIVPAVKGLSARGARDELQHAGLRAAFAFSGPTPQTQDEADRVEAIDQDKAPGSRLKRKDTVTVTLAMGGQPTIPQDDGATPPDEGVMPPDEGVKPPDESDVPVDLRGAWNGHIVITHVAERPPENAPEGCDLNVLEKGKPYPLDMNLGAPNENGQGQLRLGGKQQGQDQELPMPFSYNRQDGTIRFAQNHQGMNIAFEGRCTKGERGNVMEGSFSVQHNGQMLFRGKWKQTQATK